MSSGPSAQEVSIDVLPPLPEDGTTTPPRFEGSGTRGKVPFENLRTFYHPASGVVILGLDWLAFGTDFFTGMMALPLVCFLSFAVSFWLVLLIQLNWTHDKFTSSLGKAFIGAVMVGLPFPITGTLLGAAILVLSGLPHHPVDMVKKLAEAHGVKPRQ
jgi:hypothetical protein